MVLPVVLNTVCTRGLLRARKFAQPSVEAVIPSITVLIKKLSLLIDSEAREKENEVWRPGGAFAQEYPNWRKNRRKWNKNPRFRRKNFNRRGQYGCGRV